ncbi:MAG TPA: fimbria/pilus outer membrane usher protein [Gammaproteobacteria bacterium]
MLRLVASLLLWVLCMIFAGNVFADANIVREHWYRSSLDHLETGLTVLIAESDDKRLFVRRLDLDLLGIAVPSAPGLRYRGEWYYAANRLKNHEIHIDAVTSRIHFVRRVRPHIARTPSRDLLLDIRINEQTLSEPQYIRYYKGELVLPESTMHRLGIDPETVRTPLLEGSMPLHAIAGENFTLDFPALLLEMTVPAHYLKEYGISIRDVRADTKPVTQAPSLSAVLTYDLARGVESSGEQWRSGLFEATLAGGKNTCLSRHLQLPEGDDLLRLESYCLWDWPQQLLSLAIGDGITRSGTFGQPVRYGGIRFGSDFGLAPGLILQPTLMLSGSARVPSTLEIWVDQMLTLRTEIPPGPFEISEIPAQTGAGEIRAVIENALGTREILTEPFYSDPGLLAPGLKDWAVELGRTREDYLTGDNRYTDRFGVFNGRYGLNSWLTLEAHAEAQTASHNMIGIGGSLRLWTLGVLELGNAASITENDLRGKANHIGFSRRGRYLNVGLRRATTDSRFVQLGYPTPGGSPAETAQASIGLNAGRGISLSLGGFRRRQHDGNEESFRTAALSVQLGHMGSLLFSAFEPVEPPAEPFYSVQLTIPFGRRNTVSASAGGYRKVTNRQINLQRNLPAGPGIGYRLGTGEFNGKDFSQAEVALQGGAGLLTLAGERLDGASSSRARLTGSMVLSGNGLFLSRWREGGFAVVDVPAANVRVYHDEQLVAVTGDDGKTLIPGLRPYQANRLRLSLEDLPLNTDINTAEITVTPGRRQAVWAAFDIKTRRYVSARLVLKNGKPVPAGAAVRFGRPAEAAIAGHDGYIFLPAQPDNRLQLSVDWPTGFCRVNASLPDNGKPFVDLGTIRCQEDIQ